MEFEANFEKSSLEECADIILSDLMEIIKKEKNDQQPSIAEGKQYYCEICSKYFLRENQLQNHINAKHVANGARFKCEVCAKSFKQSSVLKQHRVIHSKDRPFNCVVCSKTFNRYSSLISHKKIHTFVKPYSCNICSKKFHQKGNLKNHLFTHTDVRPYICDYCSKGFNQPSNLKIHMQKQHSDMVSIGYKCTVCEIIFDKRYLLRNHEFEKHNMHTDQVPNFLLSNVAFDIPEIRTNALNECRRLNLNPYVKVHTKIGKVVVAKIYEFNGLWKAQIVDLSPTELLDPVNKLVAIIYSTNDENNFTSYEVLEPSPLHGQTTFAKQKLMSANDIIQESYYSSQINEDKFLSSTLTCDREETSMMNSLTSPASTSYQFLTRAELQPLINALESDGHEPDLEGITKKFNENGISIIP